MRDLQKVEGYSSLRKDLSSGGVINIDQAAYNAHQAAKKIALKNLADKKAAEESIATMREEINNMKQDINELKTLMQRILDKIG